MNVYQKAADALKAAVKASLDQDVDSNLQSEIWRHYQGMQNIANQLKSDSKFTVSLDSIDNAFEYDGIGYAAGPFFSSSSGNDVITFS